MKNLLTAFLPALALLALGGCAGTAALSSSEDDGVYYSSKDRTTAIVSTAPAPASPDEAANPDYNGNTAANAPARQNSGSDEYYDESYSYMRGVPGYGLNTYVPYSPYTSLNYGIGSYGYGWGGGGCGFSPYGICDPFYSSLYSPFGYGYGSGVSISLGFGRSFGYGRGGYGFGRPYGYGGGFYDPYYYSSPFYGGYYGRGAYYGNSYYGGNGNSNGYYDNNNGRGRAYGQQRARRATDGRYSSGSVSTPNAPSTGNGGTRGGRMRTEERVAAPGPDVSTGTISPQPATATDTRARANGLAPADGYNRPRRQARGEQPVYRDMAQPTDGGQVVRDNNRGRVRNADAGTNDGQPQAAPQDGGQRRRGGFFQNVITAPSTSGSQTADQPARQRSYDQPARQRSYEQPTRSYEAPARSYEPQQRASQPSYSAPSNSGGGGGNGGGGGRSRGRD